MEFRENFLLGLYFLKIGGIGFLSEEGKQVTLCSVYMDCFIIVETLSLLWTFLPFTTREYSFLMDNKLTISLPRTTDALNWLCWRAQRKSSILLPCQRSEGRLMSPSLSRAPFVFLSGKLVMGLVMLPLMTLHRLSLSPGASGWRRGSGRPDTRPGPEGGITWSGLTQGNVIGGLLGF